MCVFIIINNLNKQILINIHVFKFNFYNNSCLFNIFNVGNSMKNHFIPFTYNYGDLVRYDFNYEDFDFNTTVELLSTALFEHWRKHKDFYRFVKNGYKILCEVEKGKKWHMVGYITNPGYVDIPQWDMVKAAKIVEKSRLEKLNKDKNIDTITVH